MCTHIYIYTQWNPVIARADGSGTFSRYCRVFVIPKWWIYQGKQREIIFAPAPSICTACNVMGVEVTLGLRAGRERQRHCAHSSQTKMTGGRGDYTPHKDAPFVVFLCYRPPRDVPYRELDNKVGRVARTFVTRKDRKSLVITEMIIHQISLNPVVYS